MYREFFLFDKEFDEKYKVYTDLSNALQFIHYTIPIEHIEKNFHQINPTESKLKNAIAEMLEDAKYESEITKEMRDNFELYLSKSWRYFSYENYLDKNLEILFTAMNNYGFLLSRGYFLLKQKLLSYQSGLV